MSASPRTRTGTGTGTGMTRFTPEGVGYTLGVALIVGGGLVAAVTGPLRLERGSWLAAYLVLVCGVALCLISDQARLIDAAVVARAHR